MMWLKAAALGLSCLLGVSSAVVDSVSTTSLNPNANVTALPACPTTRTAAYDYIVVGAGAGGGPIAARLALKGYSVLLIDAGKDYLSLNTTIPLYLLRATEDDEISLNYVVDQYPPGNAYNVSMWYPRSQGLGGSTIHNAVIHQIPHNWDFDTIQTLFNDPSWNSTNMQGYLAKIEDNLYIPPDIGTPLGHGYGGWLPTQAPASNLLTDPLYYDQSLIDLATGVQNAVPPVPGTDWTTSQNDLAEGGGIIPNTKNSNNTRATVRDHLFRTQAKAPKALTFQLQTLVTKILTCKTTAGRVKAYGVSASVGAQLPVVAKFKGKQNLTLTNFYAKNEIIVATGTYQTPQLLMLSGIGPQAQLSKYKIPQLVNLPGVGENLQDRLEMTVVWNTIDPFVIWNGCKFLYTAATDPCLAAWQTTGHTNLYESGPAFYAHSYKSAASLPYRDVWAMFGPGDFTGYHYGWGQQLASNSKAWINVVLKGHTDAKGWVRLRGDHMQDKAEINKNQGATTGFENDVAIVKTEMQRLRSLMANTPSMNQHISSERWPGAAVATDAQLTDFIKKNTWGHHACCTSKMGIAKDAAAVVDQNFKVYGTEGLRIVDNSVWASIPGFFVTTPIYMISEKAADTVIAYAQSQSWAPTYAAVV